MAQLVEKINANNARLPTLWAYEEYEADIIDSEGQRRHSSGYGTLMYRRPDELRIDGKQDVIRIFDLGINLNEYWLTLFPQKVMWWGQRENLGKPGTRALPIRPDLIVEVLGIGPIETDFQRFPAPVMRFEHEQDAYVLSWIIPGPGRWLEQKEVWYDRQSLLPRRVRMYDLHGRVVLRAELGEHRAVKVEGVEQSQWPRVATEYWLLFPDSGSTLRLHLREPVLRDKGFPKDASFVRPTEPAVDRIEKVDEASNDSNR